MKKNFNGRRYYLYGWVLNNCNTVQMIKELVRKQGYFVKIHKCHKRNDIYYKIYVCPLNGNRNMLESFKLNWYIPEA